MDIQSKQPTSKGSAESFVGEVWFDVIAQGEAPSRLRVSIVRFSPGAHTAWHRHANGQTLHVTEGRGLVQSRGWTSSRSVQETRSTPHLANGIGMARHRNISCPTSPCRKISPMVRQAPSRSGAIT